VAKGISGQKMRRRVTTLIVVFFVIVVAAGFAASLSQLHRLQEEYDQLLEEQQLAEMEVAQLREKYAYSQTDSFIRRMARELLGWVEPGDTKIVDESEEQQHGN